MVILMSHELDITTGQPAVFVTGEPAWHKLGTVVANAVTSAQAIELARLNWEVEQWELKAFDRELGKEALVPGKYANVRKDTGKVLGVVSENYRIFQNVVCFRFVDALVTDRLAMFETAGALKDGRVVWMLARIPTEYMAGSQDAIQPYILLTNSHDGSKALRIFPTTIRVVCQNTLTLALQNGLGEGLSIRHRPSLSERVAEAGLMKMLTFWVVNGVMPMRESVALGQRIVGNWSLAWTRSARMARRKSTRPHVGFKSGFCSAVGTTGRRSINSCGVMRSGCAIVCMT